MLAKQLWLLWLLLLLLPRPTRLVMMAEANQPHHCLQQRLTISQLRVQIPRLLLRWDGQRFSRLK
jgi:hypothetical protein